MASFDKRPRSRGRSHAPKTVVSEEIYAVEDRTKSAAAVRAAEARESKQLFESDRAAEKQNAERSAEMKRAAEARRKEEEARKTAEARKAEEARRIAEEKRAEERRAVEEARRAAEEKAKKAAEELRIAEEERKAAEARAEAARRAAEAAAAEKVKAPSWSDNASAKESSHSMEIKINDAFIGERKPSAADSLTSELFMSDAAPSAKENGRAAAKQNLYFSGSEEAPARAPKHKYKEESHDEQKKKKPNFFVRLIHGIFPCKGDGVAESVRKIIFDVAVVAFVITGGSVLLDVFDELKNQTVNDKIIVDSYHDDIDNTASEQEIIGSLNLTDEEIATIQKEKPGISYSFMELYSKNPDTVGWIRVGDKNDPVINYPVVQAADNAYYLDHNFDREESKRGAIYADYRDTFSDGKLSGNTILYGHNMWNGDTMFAKLSRYYDGRLHGESDDRLSFYKKNPTVTFNTLYENSEWKVFACILFNTEERLGEVYPYNNVINFRNKEAFNGFILDLMDRSVLWTDVDLTYGDEILTLSTCYYPFTKEVADTRVAVFARKVREGESAEVDVSKAVTNNNPLKFEFQYQKEGGSWKGRTWDTSKLLSYER